MLKNVYIIAVLIGVNSALQLCLKSSIPLINFTSISLATVYVGTGFYLSSVFSSLLRLSRWVYKGVQLLHVMLTPNIRRNHCTTHTHTHKQNLYINLYHACARLAKSFHVINSVFLHEYNFTRKCRTETLYTRNYSGCKKSTNPCNICQSILNVKLQHIVNNRLFFTPHLSTVTKARCPAMQLPPLHFGQIPCQSNVISMPVSTKDSLLAVWEALVPCFVVLRVRSASRYSPLLSLGTE